MKPLHGAAHRVIPDRIETGTYAMAAAMTAGDVELVGGRLDLIEAAVADACAQPASRLDEDRSAACACSAPTARCTGVDVMTEPYPGFPTDLQAQMMALMTRAEGASMITETIFENRFMHVPELARMGANVTIHHASALVRGVPKLRGAAGDGDRPARLGVAGARRPRRRGRHAWSTASIISTAATSGSRRSSPPAAPTSSGCKGLMTKAETLGAWTRRISTSISAAVQDALVAVARLRLSARTRGASFCL